MESSVLLARSQESHPPRFHLIDQPSSEDSLGLIGLELVVICLVLFCKRGEAQVANVLLVVLSTMANDVIHSDEFDQAAGEHEAGMQFHPSTAFQPFGVVLLVEFPAFTINREDVDRNAIAAENSRSDFMRAWRTNGLRSNAHPYA